MDKVAEVKEGAKASGLDGQPKEGPKEKAGKDEVQAKLSFHDLGVKRAKEFGKLDDRRNEGTTTIRQDLIAIIKTPQEAWESYTSGMKDVLDERKKAGQATATLGVLRSQCSRVLNAAKKQHSMVTKGLEDTKITWQAFLKSLPKRSNAGAPQQVPAASAVTPGDGINVTTETNVGTLVQVIHQASERLAKIGKEKDAPFAHYVGSNMVTLLKDVQTDFAGIQAKYMGAGGVITDKAAFMKELGLVETPAAQPAAERKVA